MRVSVHVRVVGADRGPIGFASLLLPGLVPVGLQWSPLAGSCSCKIRERRREVRRFFFFFFLSHLDFFLKRNTKNSLLVSEMTKK